MEQYSKARIALTAAVWILSKQLNMNSSTYTDY